MDECVLVRARAYEIIPAIVKRSTWVGCLLGCRSFASTTRRAVIELGYKAGMIFGYKDRQPADSISLAAHDDTVRLSPHRHERIGWQCVECA